MKILIVSQHFYPENFRFNDFALALKERGHEVTVLTGIPNYPKGTFFNGYGLFKPFSETWNGIKIYHSPLIPRRNNRFFLTLNYLSFPISSTFISLFGLRDRYDAVWVCQSSPILMALSANIRRIFRGEKTYLWITDLWPESLRASGAVQNKFILWLIEIVVKFVYKHVDHILISAKGFEKSIKSKNVKTPISYFPYWAEDLYQPRTGLDSMYPNKFVMTFAGNIGASQNLNVLAEAAGKLVNCSDIQFVIIGEGRGMADFKAKIASNKVDDKFVFLGSFPPTDMPDFFARSDALFLSLGQDPIFHITVPSKVQSYMACGRPILASIDGEGADIIVESGSGFVAPSGDSSRLAEIITKMKSLSKPERESLGLKGFQYFETNFKREKLLDSIDNLISQS